ncbi:MAG: HAMP domain-containing histidine kinase, partial [Clostridia bacterium]|nr:HAMP domain-containing histidine kinase [Clostridia bacterium]
MKRDGWGNVERDSSMSIDMDYGSIMEEVDVFDKTSHIVVACSVKDEVVAEYRALWEKQEDILVESFIGTLGYGILALLLLVYLLSVCGKNAMGEYKNIWIDHIFLEFHLAWMICLGVGGAYLCVIIVDEYQSGFFPMHMMDPALGSISALGSLGILTSLLSVVRNIKIRRLLKTSFLLRIIGRIWRGCRAFAKVMIHLLSKKTGILLLVMLLFYTALIGLLGIGTVQSPLWLGFGIPLFGMAAFLVACRARDMEAIKKGVENVRRGNLTYQIPGLLCEDMKELAENVNTIAQGMEASATAQLKAERMKTELITNVSNDLKTPITSIISYAELLTKMEELPEEARDYVAVIIQKSDRLKKLTQDLFDISKARSGDDEVVRERLNLVLLLQQTLGEHNSEIQNSGLPFCVKTPQEAYISADGRKLSRVLDNLVENILKYTMKNTRVFLQVTEVEGEVVLECKNVSAYPLDFDAEEITQRFVRGDEARSTEGNGLGLAIVKSYTELCGGKFEVVIDGDMFKAILKFPKIS